MSDPVLVVGSGASGVHFALSLLRKGRRVTMIDVGRAGRPAVLPDASLSDLKDRLADPSQYLLGSRFEAVHLPGVKDEYYAIPPSKSHVFEQPEGFGHASVGFAPLFSFARGGLAESWTGGCYPLNAGEIEDFPFSYADLAPHYGEVARRIGVSGAGDDDLARFIPVHDHLQPPLRLDEHSERLMAKYAVERSALNQSGAYFGRTRVATISQAMNGREPCDYLGRCLWGCPHGALYTPSQTLRECQTHPGFEYVDGVEVSHIRLSGGSVRAVIGRELASGNEREFPAAVVALAAGALLSTRIFLQSLAREGAGRVRLGGLMDNRQVLVPFVNLGMIGRQFSDKTYQYHLLGLGLDMGAPREYVHGQITTLKTALIHPLIQRLPIDLRTATYLFRNVHAALGLVNVNFRDTRRDGSFVELTDEPSPRLRLHYAPDADEALRTGPALARVKKALWRLNCVVPPGMVQARPMGASVHYAGTLPMTTEARPYTTTAHGESRDVRNLFLVDGATFPFLPAKNLTFTLMANAVRIAESAF